MNREMPPQQANERADQGAAPQRRPAVDPEEQRQDDGPGPERQEPQWTELDPFARVMATECRAAQAPAADCASHERVEAARAAVIEPLMTALVRRAAWGKSADGRSSMLHLEVGDGPLAGATVLITADSRELHIELDAPPQIDLEAWKSRLRHRLALQGLTATIS